MNHFLLKFSIFFVLLLPAHNISAQGDRLDRIKEKLELLVAADPAYASEVDLYIGSLPVGDLLRNVAKASNVSISYKGDGSLSINCNFKRTRIDDLLYFLCKEYALDMDVVGNIVSVYPYAEPDPAEPVPRIIYHSTGPALSYNLKSVALSDVVKLMADASGINLAVPSQILTKQVSGYAVGLPVDEAVTTLASVNGLRATKKVENLWTLEVFTEEMAKADAGSFSRKRSISENQLVTDSLGMVTAQIERGEIYDILCTVCERMGLNYYFISPISGHTSLYLKDVELHTFLKVLFTGTTFSYYEEEGIYMFGASKEQALASVKVVTLHNRTVTMLEEAIPKDIKDGVNVNAFKELNSLILSGDQRKVARVEQFLKSVDKTVPLITIEVLIAETTKNLKNEAGISLGVGEAPTATTGQLSPGLDLTLGASAINSLINSFNGFGSVNLGKVNPNFYANLKLMEANGDIELHSTPKLSTLNGHEAELKSGQRRHYKEVTESLMGSQNPIQTSSYVWKYIDANLELKIVPYVSGNGEITLSIELAQTEFTTEEDKETPPGTATRSFKSEIRVLNEEMVLLGGIDRNHRNKSTKGLPFISRVPVLRWIFGQRVDNKEETKLNIFIKPTVVY